MKKGLLIIFICHVANLLALPVGNPNDALLFSERGGEAIESISHHHPVLCFDHLNLKVGYYGDFVFNRRLKTVSGKRIDYTKIATNAAYIALNVSNHFDLFTTLGATKFEMNTSLKPFNFGNPSPRFDFTSETAFSWSIGAHATLFEYKGIALGLEGQYFHSKPRAKVLFVRANVNAYPDDRAGIKYSEWQIGAGISYLCNPYFVPYAALKCSRALWEFNHITYLITDTLATIPNLKNSQEWGFAIGTSFAPFRCHHLAVTVEGRFFDETALYINAHLYY